MRETVERWIERIREKVRTVRLSAVQGKTTSTHAVFFVRGKKGETPKEIGDTGLEPLVVESVELLADAIVEELEASGWGEEYRTFRLFAYTVDGKALPSLTRTAEAKPDADETNGETHFMFALGDALKGAMAENRRMLGTASTVIETLANTLAQREAVTGRMMETAIESTWKQQEVTSHAEAAILAAEQIANQVAGDPDDNTGRALGMVENLMDRFFGDGEPTSPEDMIREAKKDPAAWEAFKAAVEAPEVVEGDSHATE